MRPSFLVVGSAAGLAVIVLAAWGMVVEYRTPSEGPQACPTYVGGALAAASGPHHPAERWEIYSEEGEKGTARVKVRKSTLAPAGFAESCELKVIWAPGVPGRASDWRIGHVVSAPERLRGRTMTFRVSIRGRGVGVGLYRYPSGPRVQA